MENRNHKHLIFDAHLDLAMNALEWNRDLRLTVKDIRHREAGMKDKPDRGKGTVSFNAMREGNVGLCVATQIARYVRPGSRISGWNSPEQAWASTQGQIAWYRAMEECDEIIQIKTVKELEKIIELWEEPDVDSPIGYLLSLEGADSIVSFKYLEKAYEYGLIAIGPVHYGNGVYGGGTDSTGGLGIKGRALLKEMDQYGFILDVTHYNDESFFEAIQLYNGPLWASHNNCRKFVNHNRQFSDDQISEIINRDGVIGVALDAWMMVPDWIRGESDPTKMGVSLELMINNIDHICQLAGNSLHAGIGSDLDGAFGKEQCPFDLDTIADLQKIPVLLEKRGYSEIDIENITSRNFIRFLRKNLRSQ